MKSPKIFSCFSPMLGRFALSFFLGSMVFSVPVSAQSLKWLGTLPGSTRSTPYGVSDDGSIVIGESSGHAFRWTEAEGMQDLGTLGGFASVARSLSPDGSIIVGWAENGNGWERAFRWTATEGMQDLGTLGGCCSNAYDVSADGTVIVGSAENSNGNLHAYRWTASEGMHSLGYPGVAMAVSADGSVIAVSSNGRAYRWTAIEGMQDLGTLGGSGATPFDISAGGSVIVGWAKDSSEHAHAFRWENGYMKDLGTLGGPTSTAMATSADGSTVVGHAEGTDRISHAFRWSLSRGMEDLNVTYASLLDSGSFLYEATGISANGRYIVGWGYHSATKRYEAFLLDTQGTMGVERAKPLAHQRMSLWPNPFSEIAHIRFQMPVAGNARLVVYDLLGRMVGTLVDSPLVPGVHELSWNGCSATGYRLPPGFYVLRLETNGKIIESRRLIIMR